MKPPKYILSVLRWFCREDYLDEIEGDLTELYEKRFEKMGLRRARRYFLWDVIKTFRLRNLKSINLLPLSNLRMMFWHNIKVSWRNLVRQRLYSMIRLGGFSLGISACILISLYIRDELSYDAHYVGGDRIFRLANAYADSVDQEKWVNFSPQISGLLEDTYPEIERATRLLGSGSFFNSDGEGFIRMINGNENFHDDGFVYADPGFLEIFEISMIYGDYETALSNPNTIVLSREKAQKYFPDINPVGRRIILNNDEQNPYVVGGVFEDLPYNAHVQFNFLITLVSHEFWPGEQTSWCCTNYPTYIKVRHGTDKEALEEKLLHLKNTYVLKNWESQGTETVDYMREHLSIYLQPIGNVHFNPEQVDDNVQHGDIKIIWVLGAAASLIMILACINFVNLSTAKAANRAKEVGIRKAIGSYRSSLIGQFLSESLLFSSLSFLAGLLLAWLMLPYFNFLANKTVTFPWNEWWLIPLILGAIVTIGFLSGLYPAFYLSRFKPISVIRGQLSQGTKASTMRNGLVIFQFTSAVILIIGTLVTYQQMQYLLNKKLGYDKEQVLLIKGADALNEKREVFKKELENLAFVQNVSLGDFLPVAGTQRNNPSFHKISDPEERVWGQMWSVDEDYLSTMGMNLVAGRNFNRDIATDSKAMIINQTMADRLVLEDPVGAKIGSYFYEEDFQIIGVVEDFHFESLRGSIGPLSMVLGEGGKIASVKLLTRDTRSAVESIHKVWDDLVPDQAFRYNFLDESFSAMYGDVDRTNRLILLFSVIALVVACSGLFALSTFIAEQRRKEICIRKVLGASVKTVFRLLTVSFLRLVFVSVFLAIPLGWYLGQLWLEDFENRISLEWQILAIPSAIVILVALIAVSYESMKAALLNPSWGLRSQ